MYNASLEPSGYARHLGESSGAKEFTISIGKRTDKEHSAAGYGEPTCIRRKWKDKASAEFFGHFANAAEVLSR